MVKGKAVLNRCPWSDGDALNRRYHDHEWGAATWDSRDLFELLVLEGMQAGLSWLTVLRKRRAIRDALAGLEPERLVTFGEQDIRRALANPAIIRHRGKLEAAVSNARAFLAIEERTSFADYAWRFVGGAPQSNRWRAPSDVPPATEASKRMSRELKKAGFRFLGPTTCYAFMQSGGLVNDHLTSCFRHAECSSGNVERCTID